MMKVVGVAAYGGPEALEVFEVPEPHAGPGEVRVRVHAASVNPGDRFLRSVGAGPDAPGPPYVPGMEAAGVVDEIGEGTAAGLRVGDRVMAVTNPTVRGGAYAQYIVVPSHAVVLAPRGASHAEAAILPMNGLTARMVVDLAGLSAGQTLAVTGGAGVVGGLVIQLARVAGLTVVADAAADDGELLRSLGAEIVVPRGRDVARRILDAVPEGVDAVADTAGVGSAELAAAVRDGGAIVLLNGEGSKALDPEVTRRRSLRLRVAAYLDYLGDRDRLDLLRAQAEAGDITLRVARTYPFARATDAHRLLEASGVRGRIVLEF